MKKLKEYGNRYGIKNVINDMGERRYTRERSIVFPNGWVASVVENHGRIIFYPDWTSEVKFDSNKKYSVATCDYNGIFDWNILNNHGAINGCLYCDTEDEILSACEVIRNLEDNFADSIFNFL